MNGRSFAPSSLFFGLFVVMSLVAPLVLDTSQQSLLTRAFIFGLMAASVDIAYGHAGLASLGHSALVGAGAYAAGILMVKYGIDSAWIGIPVAVVVASLVSLVFGMLALRAKGLYFILATFALGQMLANLAQQWSVLKSPGVDAIVGIRWPDFGFVSDWGPSEKLRAVVVIVVLAFVLIRWVLNSSFGLALRGVRDNPERMEALGYNAWGYKLAAIVVSGAFAGLAGALFAYHSGIVTPSNIGIVASGTLVLMVIFGGSGTIYGPFIGGVAVTIIQFYASDWAAERAPLVMGVLFIVTALALRGGVAGTLKRVLRRRRAARADA